VMHIASPYQLDVKDPMQDLVIPARSGTLNVLRACQQAGVKRVVLTSSMAAVTDSPDPKHTYTEDDWNELSSLKRNPYYYSKVMAERAAWDFVEEVRRV
jgi:dihydroflavonol-4-reductase